MYQAHFGLNIEDIKTYLLMNPIKDYRQGDDHRPWSLPWSLRLAPNLEHETPWPSHLHNSWSGLLIVVEHGNVWGSSLKKMFKLDHGQEENPPSFHEHMWGPGLVVPLVKVGQYAFHYGQRWTLSFAWSLCHVPCFFV